MKEYDGLFIIDPGKEKSLKEITDGISKAIVKSNGKINKEENWGKQKLSYPIRKNTEGIFYKLDFSVESSQISVLYNSYKLNPNILRVMMTVK